jgi:hypothetical protein
MSALAPSRWADAQTQLRLEAGADQLIAAEHVTRGLAVQDAAEHRLVKAELLLYRLRGQSHLPADLPLAGGDAAGNDTELDAIRLIQRQPIEPLRREILAACPGLPEFLDRCCLVQCHSLSPVALPAQLSMSTLTRYVLRITYCRDPELS